MSADSFALIFLVMLATSTLLRAWLRRRHMHHVWRHRDTVPQAFAQSISLEDHQKAADYTLAKARLGHIEMVLGVVWLLALTLGGGLNVAVDLLRDYVPDTSLWQGVALFGLVGVAGFIFDLPLDLYRTFKLEARFGFNRMTVATYVTDTLKQALLALLIGAPILWAVLWLMQASGSLWWLWTWAFWLSLNLLGMVIYPLFIAPLFNKFSPLEDDALKARIEALLARCGFRAKGLFVMDGSRRSAHSNAYFTGFGAAKRIVFFDTLLKSLSAGEIEAVLAHELGHFKRHHLWQRMAVIAPLSLALMALLGWLMTQEGFFIGLGVGSTSPAMALLLFSMVLPIFLLPFSPLTSHWSRKHEFEADAYAAQHTRAEDLVHALAKIYRDNAATLTPDPLHSLFYDSHPPASIRIAHLRAQAQ